MKVSVSLDREDLALLKKHAQEAHQGNLSAAFAEAAALLRRRDAQRRLIDLLGGPTLTLEAARALEMEQSAAPPQRRRRSRRAA